MSGAQSLYGERENGNSWKNAAFPLGPHSSYKVYEG